MHEDGNDDNNNKANFFIQMNIQATILFMFYFAQYWNTKKPPQSSFYLEKSRQQLKVQKSLFSLSIFNLILRLKKQLHPDYIVNFKFLATVVNK